MSSADPGKANSTVAANLAVAAARVGLNVALVDGDIRNPVLSGLFGMGDSTGLSDLLASGEPVRDHLLDVGVPNLVLLPGGQTPPNPAELLASPAMRAILNDLTRDHELVIIDSSPVMRVADSLELVRSADLVLLVARSGVSHWRHVQAVPDRIRKVGGVVSGVVLNDVPARPASTRTATTTRRGAPSRCRPLPQRADPTPPGRRLTSGASLPCPLSITPGLHGADEHRAATDPEGRRQPCAEAVGQPSAEKLRQPGPERRHQPSWQVRQGRQQVTDERRPRLRASGSELGEQHRRGSADQALDLARDLVGHVPVPAGRVLDVLRVGAADDAAPHPVQLGRPLVERRRDLVHRLSEPDPARAG